jgi:RNA polymerase sigma-70 factor (ECF subfamily)
MGGHQSGPVAKRAEPEDGGPENGEDQQILAVLRTGDRRRAIALCARHHGACIGRLGMALLGSQAEADDITQETLLLAYDALPQYRAEGSLRAWLLGIARRRCARLLERGTRRQTKLRLVSNDSTAPSSEELLHLHQRAEQARNALAELRPSDREAVILRYVTGLSYREVGLTCDIEESTARQRVSRALARMRAAIGTEGDDHG